MPSPQKVKRRKLSADATSSSFSDATGISEHGENPSTVEASHDQANSSVDSGNVEKEPQLARKLMNTIKRSFPKHVRDKIARLLHFILTFGSHVITVNRHGNVFIRNRTLDPASNILDLLRASVSVTTVPKPVGFKEFRKALLQINVPKSFLVEYNSNNKLGKKSTDLKSVHKADNVKIRKWESY